MHVPPKWVKPHARLVSIPTTILLVCACIVTVLSKLTIASAHDNLPETNTTVSSHLIWKTPFALTFEGIASYYAHGFHGRRTAYGVRFNMYDFTAAHRKLPFGTILRVTNPATGATILVQINDRGPFIRRRVLDLSYAAARELGIRLGAIRADGFTPADIAADSLVLAFNGPQYEPYRLHPDAFETIEVFDHFSLAYRTYRMQITDPTIALAVLQPLGAEGERYAIVRLSFRRQFDEDSLADLISP